jgi:hypothetical protein
VKLLEGVIAQYDGVDAMGDLQNKGITSANSTGRWRHYFPSNLGFLESSSFTWCNAMLKTGVDDNDDVCPGVLNQEGPNHFI